MRVTVFVQNEAGSNQKHYHDEKTLEWRRVVEVSERYPFPYGFVVGTTSQDGCNVDCFVITDAPLKSGQIVECEAIGLMEQIEDGQEDHNVLARLLNEDREVDAVVEEQLTRFVQRVFAHHPDKQISVGRFLGFDSAEAHVLAHRDKGGAPAIRAVSLEDAEAIGGLVTQLGYPTTTTEMRGRLQALFSSPTSDSWTPNRWRSQVAKRGWPR
jgi:inorganic pyrophosphatase